MENLFYDIGIIIILATLLAYIAKLLRQPFIPGYVIAGIIIGPVLKLVTNLETITILSEIGIAFLLFIVGLEIDFQKLKSVGSVSILGGIIKSSIVFSLGFGVTKLFGFSLLESLYMGILLSFSSTMIVLKHLSDVREIDTVHGRILIGTLLLEDLIAIIAIMALHTISLSLFITSLVQGMIVLSLALLVSKFFFPKLFSTSAHSQELLFLLPLAIMFIFSIIFHALGFSIAIGAFIAGITLGNSPYSIEIMGRVKPLRDFFATLFFVSLGTLLVPVSTTYSLIIALSLIAIFLKPLISMTVTSLFRYRKRTSFLASIPMGQVSEFGFIIATQGFALGHITSELLTVTIIVTIVTIAGTSYMLHFQESLYSIIPRLELSSIKKMGYLPKKKKYEIILCGHNRIGYSILDAAVKKNKNILVIDFNPDVIEELSKQKISCIYGDVENEEILTNSNMKEAQIIISTLPELRSNLFVAKKAKEIHCIAFCTASSLVDAMELYNQGADYVILPHFLGGEYVASMISHGVGQRNIQKIKLLHIQELQKRIALGHEHPKPNR